MSSLLSYKSFNISLYCLQIFDGLKNAKIHTKKAKQHVDNGTNPKKNNADMNTLTVAIHFVFL